jgi:uncharacterized protein
VSDGGLVFREAHYPGRPPIDAYGNGGFRFAGMSHRGSLLILPSGVHDWPVVSTQMFALEGFAGVLAQAAKIEILLIGTGHDLRPVPSGLRDRLRAAGISADAMSTGAAVRTFNVLLAENRAVAGAFLAVDSADGRD